MSSEIMGLKKKYTFFLFLTLFFFIVSPMKSIAVPDKTGIEKEKNEELSDQVLELIDFLENANEGFSYRRQNRPDPFMPFAPQKPVLVEKKEIPKEELKGLRRFEPGQLSLVAIIAKPGKGMAKAMVQNAAGKGFIVGPGTKIGRYGVVDIITDNMVTVKEEYRMTNGRSQTKVVKMLLKKEGEEQR